MVFYVSFIGHDDVTYVYDDVTYVDTLHTATGALVHAAGVLPDSALHGVSHTISIVSNEEEDHEDRYVIVSSLHFTVSVPHSVFTTQWMSFTMRTGML